MVELCVVGIQVGDEGPVLLLRENDGERLVAGWGSPAGAAGLKASESSFHMEVDVSGLKDITLGYGAGDFVPGLTVDYKIALKDGSGTPVTGTFMQMNASDGPHYGANIKLDQAGQYTVTITIHSPQENGWVLHVDPETGVKGRFWTQPIELTWDWDYTPQEW